MSAPPDTSQLLSLTETTYIQLVTGTFLYYDRVLDSTLLPALNELSSQQANPTQQSKMKAQQIMDYVATYPNTHLCF